MLVVFVFLQNWRATLIPMIAVPVSLIGTFAGLWLFGFSINTLTLFAMVLAIGIVVDDAIVVLENVERLMREQDMDARSRRRSRRCAKCTGAIIAIVLVLCAVFIPVAFLGGIAGQLYRQFAVTVAIAVVISGFVALTLTPALCALLLKPGDHESQLFRPFNRGFAWLTRRVPGRVDRALQHRADRRCSRSSALIGAGRRCSSRACRRASCRRRTRATSSASIMLPDGATLERTRQDRRRVAAVDSRTTRRSITCSSSPGFDLIGGGNKTNAGTSFITLKHWDERKMTAPQLAGEVIEARASDCPTASRSRSTRRRSAASARPAASRSTCRRAAIPIRRSSRRCCSEFMARARARIRSCTGINTFFRPTVPQLLVEVDREKAMALGVPVSDVFDALQSTMGSLYVNDFNMFGPHLPRADAGRRAVPRASPRTSGNVYVRSNTTRRDDPAEGAASASTTIIGPEQVERFNGFVAAKVLGSGKPGVSSGEAIAAVEQVAARDAAAGLHDRVDRPGLPGEAHRQRVDLRLRLRDRHGVPDPRGAVRALAAAGRGACSRCRSRCWARCCSCGCAAWRTTSTSRSAWSC